MKYCSSLIATCLSAITVAAPAVAQDTGNSRSEGGSQGASGEQDIIVTAQRREQRVLDVPLSIQVASGEQLNQQGINELTDLQFTTPGYLAQTNSGFTQIYMRGIGNAIYVGADPSVATFVDDVPRIYGSMTDNLIDVERIEVLKGAQGGLYGRNATGGVVNIITKQPSTDELKGDFVVSYGERNTFRAAGFFNLPLTERIAISASVQRSSHHPYIKNLATDAPYSAATFPTGAFLPIPNGTVPIPVQPGVNVYAYTPEQTADFFNAPVETPKLGNEDFWAARGKILLRPTDDLKIVLSADYWKKNDNMGSGQVNLDPPLTQTALQGYFGLLGVDAVLPIGFVRGTDRDFASYAGFASLTRFREYGFAANVAWSAPNFDITSITAYRNQTTAFQSDVNSANVPTALLDVRFRKHFTYQELRAVSTFGGPWRLIIGGTYLDNRQTGGQKVALLNPAIPAGDTLVEAKVVNWSAYAEVGYDITKSLSITASGRYIHEKNNANFSLPVLSSAKTVQKKFVPSVTVQYDLGDGNIYARWARGFKTGGINLATAASYYPRPEDGSIFGPETVDTFEVGYKQALLNNRLQFTAAVFYNSYKDLQVDTKARPTFPQITTAVINAQSARTWGIEGSVAYRVADPLTLSVSAGYLNAKYRDFRLVGSIALEDFDQSGFQMPKAPKLQMSFNADLDQPIDTDFRLVGNLLVSHVSRVIFQHSPSPGLADAVGPAYWLANGRIGVRTTDDKYGLALVAENIFDKAYYTFGQSTATGFTAGWGNPRIIRAEASVKF